MFKFNFMKVVPSAFFLFAAFTQSTFADTTIKVSLWSKGMMMNGSSNMMFGMGMHGKMGMAMMGIGTDHNTVPSGKVTFDVTNVAVNMIHEMIVEPLKDETVLIPYSETEHRINEKSAGNLGEVSALNPSKSGTLTIDLKPGIYILYCNIPRHYQSGMWTTLKVQ